MYSAMTTSSMNLIMSGACNPSSAARNNSWANRTSTSWAAEGWIGRTPSRAGRTPSAPATNSKTEQQINYATYTSKNNDSVRPAATCWIRARISTDRGYRSPTRRSSTHRYRQTIAPWKRDKGNMTDRGKYCSNSSKIWRIWNGMRWNWWVIISTATEKRAQRRISPHISTRWNSVMA